MRSSAWLVVSKKGIQRMAKTRPGLGAEELAVAVTVDIPDALFHRPTLAVNVTVDNIDALPVIASETIVNIEDQLRTAFGMDVSLVVRDPAEQP